ncbi:MAG: hypothetical protein HYX78_09750 [Armatimonadetes bacterium]|nr:hypothetical protein [Armatimonadota bacterium]
MSERTAKLRRKLAAGERSPGAWIALASPMAAEVMAEAGFDWVIVDAEHNPFNSETLLHILLAFRGSDTVPLIRVPWNDPVTIKQALDMGYEGIVTPQTNTVEDARRAVEACRYPPVGRRGFGPMRPGGYYRDGGEYVRTANDSIICAIQIENVCGAEDIDSIVKVPGIDWVLVGRYDMSASVGVFGDVEHPDLWKAALNILGTAKAAGIPTGIPLGGPDCLLRTIETGSQLVAIGQDCAYLQSGADGAVRAFYEAIRNK